MLLLIQHTSPTLNISFCSQLCITATYWQVILTEQSHGDHTRSGFWCGMVHISFVCYHYFGGRSCQFSSGIVPLKLSICCQGIVMFLWYYFLLWSNPYPLTIFYWHITLTPQTLCYFVRHRKTSPIVNLYQHCSTLQPCPTPQVTCRADSHRGESPELDAGKTGRYVCWIGWKLRIGLVVEWMSIWAWVGMRGNKCRLGHSRSLRPPSWFKNDHILYPMLLRHTFGFVYLCGDYTFRIRTHTRNHIPSLWWSQSKLNRDLISTSFLSHIYNKLYAFIYIH